MKIDRQFIVNMLEQYLNGEKVIQDIANFTFDTIFSDEEMVSKKHSKLIYEIIFYLDNVDNGMLSFSKSQAKSLVVILESIDDQEVGIELLQFVKFREEIIKFISGIPNIKEKRVIIEGFKKFGFNENLIDNLAKYVEDDGRRKKLEHLIEEGDVSAIEVIIRREN